MNNSSAAPDTTPTSSTPSSTGKRPRVGNRRAKASVLAVAVVAAVTVAVQTGDGEVASALNTVVRDTTAGLTDGDGDGAGVDDGVIGDRTVTPADDEPAISNLEPELLAALRAASRDAEADGIEVLVTSGWRSRAYQQRLLDEAVTTYATLEEARRWVSTPQKSSHVSGRAVDVGPTDAAYWFSQHGADHGLCQTFGNEIWHYELLTDPGGVCPTPRPDAGG